MGAPLAGQPRPSSALGSLAWTRQTGGVLRGRDRWTLLAEAARYGLAVLPSEVRRALGIARHRGADVDPVALRPPDSAAAREAERIIEAFAPPMVVNHGYRTYAWGAALAANERRSFDREVVYVASLLHDLYWSAPDAMASPHCFTLPAAEDAIALGARCGWNQARAQAAAEAITLHLNIMPPSASDEAYVVFVGARLDIIGYRYRDLAADTVDRVLGHYPRLNFKQQSLEGFENQSRANPGTRVHFHTRILRSKWFCMHAPFDE